MTNKLTKEELKRATKLAIKGRRELTIAEMKALEAANRADAEFKPLAQLLTENQKKKLQKAVRIKK